MVGTSAKSRDFEDDDESEYGCTGTTGDSTVSKFNIDFEAEAESKGGHRAGPVRSAEEFERNRLTCVGPGLEVGEETVWKE
jgi:hypothetical protein